MKKKIIAICLCVALVAVGIVGATLAYFTDKDQVKNTFEIGNVDIDLYEKTDAYPEQIFQNNLDYSNIMPGDYLSKEPYIRNESDTNAAYVRVFVQINNHKARNAAIDEAYAKQGQNAVQAKYDYIFDGWGINNTKVYDGIDGYTNVIRNSMAQRAENPVKGVNLYNIDSVRIPGYTTDNAGYQYESWNMFQTAVEVGAQGVNLVSQENGYYANAIEENSSLYVFYLKLEPGAEYQLFNGLNVPADFTAEQMAMFEGLKIDIYADAIQVDNFTDTTDETTGAVTPAHVNAFNALQEANPLGWWNKTAA